MSHSDAMGTDRVGPFTIGSTSSDVVELAKDEHLGLSVLDRERQNIEYDRSRCEALQRAAEEFFLEDEHDSSLILKKNRPSEHIPDFIEFILCWFAEDRLSGLVLSGVTSDAGSHEQINNQEAHCRGHAAEIIEALEWKYPKPLDHFVNLFNFEIYTSPPKVHGLDPDTVLTRYERLVHVLEENPPGVRVETSYCGPSLILQSRRSPATEATGSGSHTTQFARRVFANDGFFVVYDNRYERYVRTFESIHMFDTITYLSKAMMAELGSKRNAARCDQVHSRARQDIDEWNESTRRSEEARKSKIRRLSEIL